MITWIVRTVQEKGLEQQLKTPATKKKKKNTAAAAEPREEKEEQQQAATESGEKQQQQRRSNLSPQKHRAAKFYAKEDQTQNQDT